MYLKSIEVQGFKSFAHKIKFDFSNGITAIVGPNGSGKSNVADAVRWVLGEQRIKQLRGGTMQDVIFSGTENRKPLSYASVAITLDNTDHQLAIDYKEVTVTRKLYRSGESEYLINGSTCRLKDINELFYDTGIGKEGYSIIGQGQIDKILSGKPEERRELFDEAAGIVKFKRRKNASLKKLDDERQNLVRVRDILSELEMQVGPLAKQSEKAKKYLEKKAELKSYDINLFLVESQRIKGQLKEQEALLANAKSELLENTKKYDQMKIEYREIENALEKIEQEVEQFSSKRNETLLLKQELENKIALYNEQIRSAKQSDEHFESRQKTLLDDIQTKEEVLANYKKEEEELLLTLAKKKEERDLQKNSLVDAQTQIATLSNEVETKKADIIDLLNTRASTKGKIQKYRTMLEQLEAKSKELKTRIIDEKNEEKSVENAVKEHESELKNISGIILEKKADIDSREAGIKEQETLLKEKNDSFALGQKTFHREHSRLESLKNITERYDGYGNSIRKVMERKKEEIGLVGVVADIIQVDKDYEIAIETALGGSIQNIVTEDESTAKRMINYLKKNKFGRATFLPLTSIRTYKSFYNQDALNESGVVGLASSLAKTQDKYQDLCEFLLGRTLVVDHIDSGVKIAKKYKQSLRIVTLEGELINPGGSMTGGAFKNTSNLLSRKREIEEFEKSVKLLKQEMDALEGEISQIKEQRAKLYKEIDEINANLKEEFVRQNTAKMNLDASIARQKSLEFKLENNLANLEDTNRQIDEIKENQESIQVELDTSENLEQNLQKEIEERQNSLRTLNDEEKKALTLSEKGQLDLAAMEQKHSYTQENIERVLGEIAKDNEALKELAQSKGDSKKEVEEKEAQIEALLKNIEDSKEIVIEIDGEIEKQKKLREELNSKNSTFLENRDEVSAHMSELEKEIFRLESREENLNQSKDKLIGYMWEEYELTLNGAMELKDETLTDLGKMRKRIGELKSEIRSLGDVNVNAIEDYKQVQSRYEFLKTQHDDLIEAEKTLMQIIEELDQAMRKQFNDQFGRICEEFNKVFKELFGGGKGTLELTEGEDILEAGIKIIAQPPGKKLQNMMQLSGGEKALTAISLLFAIQNLKPSPFCLLDEIEAALDDSNVGRFANYLHKLTKNTQFIVITHRRGTMTAADRLYGITMQEKGISTLVSVSLLENELSK
ncbi:chromosome segregation protein [Aequitasia blattaphilus]|uniref:Chromosome partition protein Smc n=1 Tax=Aequitasia blattaphilus TaxID=2949332 RepID=A0ABT1E7A5_9FIRM|nr:chromosome segregation protein SMC [Aequitasia blattaphilus]MCP1101658.1 chromosome segregation protein SMC [Aequitasia blattaphilus]MCR8614298.1 chromosome segregation protein SMC [Aequitasia blattaphilus]